MKLRSEKTEYETLRKLKTYGERTAFLAHSEKGPALLIRHGANISKGAAEYFRPPGKEPFPGFVELFYDGPELWLVFEYQLAGCVPLEQVAQAPDLNNKDKLASALIEAALRLPWPVMNDVLRPERVFVEPNGEIRFLYLLSTGEGYGRDCRASAMRRLAGALRAVYGEDACPQVNEFIKELAEMRYLSADDISAAFSRIFCAVEDFSGNLPEKLPAVSLIDRLRGLWERYKESIQKALKRAAYITAVLLLAAGYIATGMEIYNAIARPPITGDLEFIGTVKLNDDEAANEPPKT